MCRIATDIICVIISLIFGGNVGIGTVIMAFGTGPVVQFFNEHVSKPCLYHKGRGKYATRELLNQYSDRLSENDLYIWDYVEKHKKQCENMTIEELARKCNVSRTTVLRFTKKLSLKGFGEFKVHLKMENDDKKQDTSKAVKVCLAYEEMMQDVWCSRILERSVSWSIRQNEFLYMEQVWYKRSLQRNLNDCFILQISVFMILVE